MRGVFGLVLIIGLGLAGFAVYMIKGYIDQQQQMHAYEQAQIAARLPSVDVVAVTAPVVYGQRLTPADVQIIQYTEPYLPEGVFRSIEDLFPAGDAQPRIVTRPMEALEPVLAVKVTAPGGNAGITSLLKPGFRAFAIRVDAQTGVSGLLRPGDRVDVFWTGRPPLSTELGGATPDITQLIVPSIEIIAIDQSTDSTAATNGIAQTVTVQGTTEQVASLQQAQSSGRLSLALVGSLDTSVSQPVVINQGTLLGIDLTAPAPEPIVEEVAPEPVVEEPKVCTTRVSRGTEKVEMVIPCPTE